MELSWYVRSYMASLQKSSDTRTEIKERENNMLRTLQGRKGFTLIELLVVVVIIGVLAAIAIPQYSSYRMKACNSAAACDLKNAKTALEAAYLDTSMYPL